MTWARRPSARVHGRRRAATKQPPVKRGARGPASARPEVSVAEMHVRDVVVGSGTSFYWGMRLLPKAKRMAMYAIYALCREVDDVADGEAPIEAKLEARDRRPFRGTG